MTRFNSTSVCAFLIICLCCLKKIIVLCVRRTPSIGINSIDWKPVNKDSDFLTVQFLKIASPTHIHMDKGVDMGRTTFWDSLEFNENENFFQNYDKQ